MIILKDINSILELLSSSTANLDYTISYVDIDATGATGNATEGTISSATTTIILAAPAAGTIRQVKTLTVVNRHASTTNNVTIQKDISSTNYLITTAVPLLAGESIIYMDGVGWTHYNSSGIEIVTSNVTLTGDVTGSGTESIATTIANNVVNNAKAADVPTATFKGRITAATGDPEDLTQAQATSLINPATTLLQGAMSSTDKKRMSQVFDAVADFGFVGDLITVFDGAMTSGLATLTCATSVPFAITDIGKRITVPGAGVGGAQLTTTISGFTSVSTVTLAVAASTTVSVKGVSFGTDNTTAIGNMTTMINTTLASFPGAKIIFGRSATNAYGFPIPVIFNKTVEIEGIGGAFNTDNGDYTRIGGTRLAWWGTTSDGGVDFGAFFTFQPGAGATQALKNVSVKDCWFDGRNGDQNAGIFGIRFAGCHAPIMDNVFFMDFRGAGFLCNATAISISPTSDRGVLRPSFKNIFIRSLETFVGAITTPITTSTVITLSNTGQNITVSAATMPVDAASTSYAWIATNEGAVCLVKYTGGGTTTLNVKCSVEDAVYNLATVSGGNVVSASPSNASCIIMSGDITANTNCGIFQMAQLSHGTTWGPAALSLRNCDSNDFVDVYINGGNPTNDGAINRIRKEGVRLTGSNVDISLTSRNNTFRNGDASSSQAAGISSMGLLNTGVKLAFPSGPNYWDLYQLGNGARIPIVEQVATSGTQGAAGASFDWTPNGGVDPEVKNLSLADQTVAAATFAHLLGSMVTLPPQGFQVGTAFKWTMIGSKTAAGTAARTFHVRVGTTGSTADAIVATLTMPVGTAAADTGVFTLTGIISAIGAAATLRTALSLTHAGGSATVGGFTALGINSPVQIGTPTTFNSVTSGLLYISVTLTTGAAEVITFQQIMAEVINCANP